MTPERWQKPDGWKHGTPRRLVVSDEPEDTGRDLFTILLLAFLGGLALLGAVVWALLALQ